MRHWRPWALWRDDRKTWRAIQDELAQTYERGIDTMPAIANIFGAPLLTVAGIGASFVQMLITTQVLNPANASQLWMAIGSSLVPAVLGAVSKIGHTTTGAAK